MWQAAPVAEDDQLRQGDLLVDIVFPSLKLPILVTGIPPSPDDRMIATYTIKTALVVSQCCANADDYVALAPVRPEGNLSPQQEAALLAAEPPTVAEIEAGEANGYTMDSFRLEPVAGVIEDGPGRYQIADLGRVVSCFGACASLRSNRRARMTPEGRRLLRINLGLFWARPEEGDAERLSEAGLPPGLR